ncbi:FKBP-type peptidyl-prolyl cis-trans isomerase FkpA precursor [Rubripirellula lacrimiformis]|uniref:Peptidyl-prolyl cis-trans isomerase n=1 Tax=Rubripirellula lacrimiformis TaxID=1930273 RepID=A0A517NHE7_9BACT|nr:FKBP-type peptidyl-prolyl cis-trans isomerase [Rubripirellula lacrimiformis]QDT06564.1 FKBP-type peptidyl-prolyl cis-trans isomerase FkpA precursor [Rubripirellula lacrimiformis]
MHTFKISGRPALWLLTFLCLTAASCAGPQRGPASIDPDAPEEFTTTDSGLKYRILRKGNGEMPGPSDRVTVDYSGWLDNGQIFDSSYTRNEPTSFGLNGVIPGWTEGLQYVSEGGMIELEIPSELGYGTRGTPGIPPNATLHFKVELLDIR